MIFDPSTIPDPLERKNAWGKLLPSRCAQKKARPMFRAAFTSQCHQSVLHSVLLHRRTPQFSTAPLAARSLNSPKHLLHSLLLRNSLVSITRQNWARFRFRPLVGPAPYPLLA
jgi:hypothetical protein